MFDRDRWTEIFEALGKNLIRTILTAFGVSWGIAMLIIMMGAGTGLKNFTMADFGNSATNSMFLWTQGTSMPYKGFKRGRYFRLKYSDAEALETAIPELDLVAPRNQLGGYRGTNNVIRGINTGSYTVYGDIPEILKIDRKKVTMGRFINQGDMQDYRKVCVIGQQVLSGLFKKDENPIGESIKINGVNFMVVGVFLSNRKGGESDEDEQSVFIPFSTFGRVFNYGDNVGWFAMKAKDGQSIDALAPRILHTLAEIHSVHPEDKRAFGYWSMEEEYQKILNIFTGINGLSLTVGIFSLLAGAIGISNIMLIVVKERTKEIGIRRALGATPLNIQTQIVLEALILTVVAGISGIIFGVWVLELIDKNAGEIEGMSHPTVGFGLVFSSFLFLIFVGILAGLLPANRATRMKPVDAFRAED